jgi:hypothetical protein
MASPVPDAHLATHEILSKVISRFEPGTKLRAVLFDVEKRREMPARTYTVEQQKFEERSVLHFKDESFRLTKDYFLIIDYDPSETELASESSAPSQPPVTDAVSREEVTRLLFDKLQSPLSDLASMIDKRITAIERTVGIEAATGAATPGNPPNPPDQRNSPLTDDGVSPDPLGGIGSAPKKFVVSITLPAEIQLISGKPQVLVDPNSTYAPRPQFTVVPGSAFAVLNTSKLDDKRWEILANFYLPKNPARHWLPFSPPHLLIGTRTEVDKRLDGLALSVSASINVIIGMYLPKPPKPPADQNQKPKKDQPAWTLPDNRWAVTLYEEATLAYVAAMKRIAAGVYPQTPSDWEADIFWVVANLLMHVANRHRPHLLGGAAIYNKYRAALDASEPTFEPASWFKDCFA